MFTKISRALLLLGALAFVTSTSFADDVDALSSQTSNGSQLELAQGGPPLGRGPRGRGGFGRGPGRGNDEAFQEDHKVFFYLLEHRKEIQRKVENLPNGIKTLTESSNPEVAGMIQEHVAAMYDRVENVKPIHMRDPLFREIFSNAKKIKMDMKETDKGILVTETSNDPYVVKLLQIHAKVVSLFIQNGHDELHKNHPVPNKNVTATNSPSDQETSLALASVPAEKKAASEYPKIQGHGKIVHLPNAVEQPRPGSKICVDITKGGPADEANGAISKVARYVNIYAGAGKNSADVEIAVILHGDATLCALNSEAYAKEFKTDGNPNLEILSILRGAGVKFCVCGQSLASKGYSAKDVNEHVEVAVSALTGLVNRQHDGFAYVPMLK